VGGSKNNPVELSILHTFKRMRHFQPFTAIVEAMRESTFLELCEDDTCVRRREPLPASLDNGPDPNEIKVFEDRAQPRSVYAKGFGEEKPSTQFDIEKFFAEYGTTNAVRLRRSEDKTFKGSVFVEFDSEETAQKFLESDPKPTYNGKELQIMSKKEYCDKKVEDIKAGRIPANRSHEKPRRDGRGGRDFKRKRDDEDDRDWRVRREEDRKSGHREGRRGRGEPDYTKGGKPKYNKVEKDAR
jgi:lupus La protein